MSSVNLIFLVIIVGLIGALVLLLLKKKRKWDSLNLKILQIRVPRTAGEEKGDPLKEINLSEQLFSTLSSIKIPFTFEVAVKNIGEEINFFLSVPRPQVDFAKRAVQGLFLDAKVDEVPDYTIFQPHGTAVAGYLVADKTYYLPITTYGEAQADLFGPILSTLSRVQESDEGLALQFVVQPANDNTKKSLTSALEQLKKGEKFSKVASAGDLTIKEVYKVLTDSGAKDGEKKEVSLDEEMIKAVGLKLSKPLFAINVRIITSSVDLNRAEDLFLSIASAFSKFSSPIRNSFKIVKPKNTRSLIFNYVFREFDRKQQLILNTEELASIFHLPTATTDVPNVTWLKVKESAPPEVLPTEGLRLGQSVFRGSTKDIRITDDDRRRHLYLVGQTGTGKSVMLQNLALQDMQNGKGLCVIDPHGDLIDKLLSFVPKERLDDVIVFDPGDRERPIGLNMLEYDFNRPEEKTFIINELLSIFNQLFDKQTMGPMFERYLRGALLLLMEDVNTPGGEPATLMEIPRVFTDEEFRKRKLARSTNQQVIDFWTKEVVKTTGDQGLGNFAPYISSKFDSFISNDYIRPIIGQPKSSFDFRRTMDDGKIILVNLSKGKIGDISSSLLGMVIVGKILKAALSRVDMNEQSRRDFYLYIDEFQNYTTDSIAVILSEARKYRLNLTIAHQFIAQLTDNIREAVFGNVGNMVTFRIGVKDAESLAKFYSPVFNEKDLISIENLNAFVKILIKGEPATPFNIKFTWATGGSKELAEGLKELSRLRYGQDLATIETDIQNRLRN